jgi:hypothetical protein
MLQKSKRGWSEKQKGVKISMQDEMTIWHMIRREQIHIEKGINTLPALPEALKLRKPAVPNIRTRVFCYQVSALL